MTLVLDIDLCSWAVSLERFSLESFFFLGFAARCALPDIISSRDPMAERHTLDLSPGFYGPLDNNFLGALQ
jgi:hypothetical protein